MSCLYILIDSSTKGSKRNKYGKSTAFWCAFWNEVKDIPCRAGVVYSLKEGPNKIFYDGIIRALEACFYMVYDNCPVKVMGDNELVIKQLKGERNVDKMKKLHSQVKGLEFKYKEHEKGVIEYDYMNEDDEMYRKVDRCAKEFLNFLTQRFN
jgi:ribonuclease HI